VTVHVVPTGWALVLLALGAYRLTRLVGWDDFPLAVRARDWAVGPDWEYPEDSDGEPDPVFRRPKLAHFLVCPFCVGFWISLACYLGYLLAGRYALAVLAPFAISAVVGLVSKNLDG
jgi:hypothetical protein